MAHCLNRMQMMHQSSFRNSRPINATKRTCVTVTTRAFPHEMFVNRLHDLNRQDEMCQTKTYRVKLCELCPQKYHDVVNSLDEDVIDVLDYIRVMYKPPME
jgi:hypothetical protein